MDPDVQILNGKLMCLKQNHHEPVEMIVMDAQIPLSERLLCLKCFKSRRQISKYISLEEATTLIEEKLHQLNEKQEEQKIGILQILNDFSNQMVDIRSRIISQIDEILVITSIWTTDIRNMGRKSDVNNIFEDLELLSKSNQQLNPQDFNKKNQSYLYKIDLIYQQLINIDDYKNCNRQLQNISNIKISQEKGQLDQQKPNEQKDKEISQPILQSNIDQDNKVNVSKVQLIQTAKQDEWSYAISFNNQGSIMVSGFKNDIKVWKTKKGKIMEKQKLSGHTDWVYCLVFSKKYNWFASGGADNTIRCWKEQPNQDWISSRPGKQHTNIVGCLILNKKEDQLLSCSADNTIKAWKVNCQNNLFEYDYTFDKKHKGDVYCISFNESQIALVSCGSDKLIILWMIGQKQKWEFQHAIAMEDYGFRISFIGETQIAWQQSHKGITHILECKNKQLIKRIDLDIELNQTNNDDWLFPMIVNKKRQIFIQKHNRYVYILKIQPNGTISMVSEPLDCGDKYNFGALTEHGNYLTIWNSETKEFKIYNIQYS